MRIRFLGLVLFFFGCLLQRSYAADEFKMDLQPEGLYLNNLNTGLLQRIFADFGYDSFINDDKRIPSIMLESMPIDFDKFEPKSERNRLFIMIMSPLVLKVNEEIVFERDEIEQLKKIFDENKTLSDKQKQKIEDWAVKYDVFTRIKGDRRYDLLLQKLLIKVDELPPSLLIAVAAAESNWGTAVEVKEGNALYKLKNWFSTDGIKPKDETDDSYRIKTYPNLLSAIREYAVKLNSDVNYRHLWISRQQLRKQKSILKGRITVYNMVVGSPLENYAGLLSYILTFYDLINVDMSELYNFAESLEKK
ncbi:MAG: glucosaminidase domain-containing protein [Alphaproteobacteria bacterium]|nr:glucosaminidase domain-containing protein [Alphaproteobacteria bacterium]